MAGYLNIIDSFADLNNQLDEYIRRTGIPEAEYLKLELRTFQTTTENLLENHDKQQHFEGTKNKYREDEERVSPLCRWFEVAEKQELNSINQHSLNEEDRYILGEYRSFRTSIRSFLTSWRGMRDDEETLNNITWVLNDTELMLEGWSDAMRSRVSYQQLAAWIVALSPLKARIKEVLDILAPNVEYTENVSVQIEQHLESLNEFIDRKDLESCR